MVLVSKRARSATFLTIVETTLMKAHVATTWHVVTLNKTCAPGNSRLMMNSTGPGLRVRLRLLQLGQPEIIPWVPWQVGNSLILLSRKLVGSCLKNRSAVHTHKNEQRKKNGSKRDCWV